MSSSNSKRGGRSTLRNFISGSGRRGREKDDDDGSSIIESMKDGITNAASDDPSLISTGSVNGSGSKKQHNDNATQSKTSSKIKSSSSSSSSRNHSQQHNMEIEVSTNDGEGLLSSSPPQQQSRGRSTLPTSAVVKDGVVDATTTSTGTSSGGGGNLIQRLRERSRSRSRTRAAARNNNENGSGGRNTSSDDDIHQFHQHKELLVAVTSCRSDGYYSQKAPGSISKLPRKAPTNLKLFHELAVGVKDAYAAVGATPHNPTDDEKKKLNTKILNARIVLWDFIGNLDFVRSNQKQIFLSLMN